MRLALKIQTKLSPQLAITSTLLQADAVEIERLLLREVADNPALQLLRTPSRTAAGIAGAASTHTYARTHESHGRALAEEGGEWALEELVAQPSALEQLARQLMLVLGPTEEGLAEQLLQLLDAHGYLRYTAAEVAAELAIDEVTAKRLLTALQELDPPGIGAYDLRACFALQCRHLAAEGVDCTLVQRILAQAWEPFVNRSWPQVARKLAVPAVAVEKAWRFVQNNLYPYPLSLLADGALPATARVTPDLVIHRRRDGEQSTYAIEMPAADAYVLRVSGSFGAHLATASTTNPVLSSAEQAWVQQYVDRARLFVTGMEQRWATLRAIADYVIAQQAGFFELGPRALTPLTRAMVGAALGYHESTVSRAVQGKYIQLPTGRIVPFSLFFDQTLAAKLVMQQILASSSQPLSDRLLAEQLEEEGICLARRTVAKYREQLNRQRFSWN